MNKFKHNLLKLLLCSSLVACNGGGNNAKQLNLNTNLGLKVFNGKPLSELPKNSSIAKLANATIGFEIDGSSCSGIAISDQLAITAAHCVLNKVADQEDVFSPKKIQLVELYSHDHWMDYTQVTAIKTAYVGGKMVDGQDIAIMQFPAKTFKVFLDKQDLLTLPNLGNDPNTVTSKMADQLFIGNDTTLYALGWGSNKKFEFASQSIYPEGNEPLASVQFGDGMFGTFDKSTTVIANYNQQSMKAYQGFNYTTDIEDAVDTNNASLPNILVYQTHDYEEMVEKGDSGGPIFICKKDLPCKLAAITTGVTKAGEEVSTTFITPFFNNLIAQFDY